MFMAVMLECEAPWHMGHIFEPEHIEHILEPEHIGHIAPTFIDEPC